MSIKKNKVLVSLVSIVSFAIICLSWWIFFGDNIEESLKVYLWVIFLVATPFLYLGLVLIPGWQIPFWVERAVSKSGGELSKPAGFLVGVAVAFLSSLIFRFGFFPLVSFLIVFFGGSLKLLTEAPRDTFTMILFVFSVLVSSIRQNNK